MNNSQPNPTDTTPSPTDWVEMRFPGRGDELATDQEWDRADEALAAALHQLGAGPARPLIRTNPNRMCVFSPYRGNRAYLRSQMRRQWLRANR